MKPHLTLGKIVVMLLLFAQQGAYAHAITHIATQAPAKEQLAHSKACSTCASFESISGVAPASVPESFVLPGAMPSVALAGKGFQPLAVSFFQSRAPPYTR